MEIQSDLIILPPNNHLPLPWSVRGPLGLETGSEVSIALVHSGPHLGRLPDIIVSPLQSEFLTKTYTLEVELGERPGAVADYLSWLGDSIDKQTGNKVNIVLSETITLEGGQKHKMHLVLEPAFGASLSIEEITQIASNISEEHALDIVLVRPDRIYTSADLNFLLQQSVQVRNGWLQYDGWMKRLTEKYPTASEEYDLTKVVVSCNPQQRLLRFIIPRKGVIELRVPHRNRPGALREISGVVRNAGYNILSSRLSRTPPPGFAASTSVFVAACEPLSQANPDALRAGMDATDTRFSIESISIHDGRPAEKSLYLTPRRREMVRIDPDVELVRQGVRRDLRSAYFARHNRQPRMFVFVSRRFIHKATHKAAYEEQARTLRKIVKVIEETGCAVVAAGDPGQAGDDYVYNAVFGRLWASDACLVLALDEHQTGRLSDSIAHEIGFFAGRNRPLKVLVAASREKDPVFGNIVGKNRLTYPDGEAAFADEDPDALYGRVKAWLQGIMSNQDSQSAAGL